MNLKIDPKKLVMGVPWYGYDYPCLNLSQVRYCSLKSYTVEMVVVECFEQISLVIFYILSHASGMFLGMVLKKSY